MKKSIIILAALLAACTSTNQEPAIQNADAPFFIGAWALDLEYDNNNAGWLEVTQEDGYLDAELLWRWGSVNPVEFVFVAENHLMVTNGRNVVREEDEEGNPLRTHHLINWLNITKTSADEIYGIAFFPDPNGVEMEKIEFTGKRLPAYGSKPNMGTISYEKAIELFNGKDLSGWKLLNGDGENGWYVKDGILINDPVQKEGEDHIAYGNLQTEDVFNDFTFSLEVNVPEGSNSGIYLRGIYEIQVMDSYGRELDSHNMGALYSRITPLVSAEKPANEWQTMEITLYKRHVTVMLNGQVIINNQPVKGVTGGAISSDEFKPGPLYLQGDHGKVMYRNIVLKPIK
ncbi:DUF1080 domain-containing protein [Bacteroidota bacterium]